MTTHRTRWAWIAALVVAACAAPPEPPQLALAIPAYGPVVGGTRITLVGTGFAADDAGPVHVVIAGREAPLAVANDDLTLDVVIPPGAQPGDAEVVVFNDHGTARATGIFHYSTPPAITGFAPDDVVYWSSDTRVTITGLGFSEEGAGAAQVVVDGQLASDVRVEGDRRVTFIAPPGRALVRPEVEVVDQRGSATAPGFRYTPGASRGLLLFSQLGAGFAVFYEPVTNMAVTIPWVGSSPRLTAVVRDDAGEYWGADRFGRFGRVDMRTQTLVDQVQTQGWFPTMVRVGDDYLGIERSTLRFGKLDPLTGTFTPIGTETMPCCGSYGLAFDGTTVYLTSRLGAAVTLSTIDPVSGVLGAPVTLTASPWFHVEEMRFLDGTLYATSRDGTLVKIDPTTGTTSVLPVSLGRFNAMEIYE